MILHPSQNPGPTYPTTGDVRHVYFLGANVPDKSLKTTLKTEISEETWATLNSDTSRPFDKPASG